MQKRIRKLSYRTYGLTDPGRMRPNNEDAFIINKDLNYFVVADGMGGMARGEDASQMATKASEQLVEFISPSLKAEDTFTEDSYPPSHEEAMRQLVEKTNRAIYKKNLGQEKKMGTTFVCARILDGKMYVANSGDSRCYHISRGGMHQLTEDHSKVEELIQSGRAVGKEPELNKMRRYVRGALGVDPDVCPDIITSLPKRGEIYLLCSDGLTKMLDDDKICGIILAEKDIKKACHKLVDLANDLGGRDNITVLMIEIIAVESVFAKKSLKPLKRSLAKEDTFTD